MSHDASYVALAAGPHDEEARPIYRKPPTRSIRWKTVAIGVVAPVSVVLALFGLSTLFGQRSTGDSEGNPTWEIKETMLNGNPLSGYWVSNDDRRGDSRTWGPFSGSCLPPGGDNGTRAENVDGWEWMLDGGVHMRQWAVEEFVARALKSRLGYVIVGDSLSDQMFRALHAMLLPPHVMDWPGPLELVDSDDYKRTNISLNQAEDLYQRLSNRPDLAQVPPKRFIEPFLRFYRADMLLDSEAQVDSVVEAAGLTPQTIGVGESYTNWLGDMKAYGAPEALTWEGEEPSLIMISTGPHWDGGHGPNGTDENFINAYGFAMTNASESLLTIEGLPLDVYFRSTLPGHKNCINYTEPVSPSDPIAVDPTGERGNTFRWHLFPEYNRLARDAFNGRKNEEGNVQLNYFDVWEMSATRPDAHVGSLAGNTNDCLHWCLASVPQVLARLWWHVVSTEKQ